LPAHFAAKFGHLPVLQFLMGRGGSLTGQNSTGATPLMWAAGDGHVTVCRFLIAHGANPNTTTFNGWTAFHSVEMNPFRHCSPS
jgi:ankyrin repeat protein